MLHQRRCCSGRCAAACWREYQKSLVIPSKMSSSSLQPVVTLMSSDRCSATMEAVVKPIGTSFHAASIHCTIQEYTLRSQHVLLLLARCFMSLAKATSTLPGSAQSVGGVKKQAGARQAGAVVSGVTWYMGQVLPSFCIFSTFASLSPLIAVSSFFGACARASRVWMPPSISFLMSAAGMPCDCGQDSGRGHICFYYLDTTFSAGCSKPTCKIVRGAGPVSSMPCWSIPPCCCITSSACCIASMFEYCQTEA